MGRRMTMREVYWFSRSRDALSRLVGAPGKSRGVVAISSTGLRITMNTPRRGICIDRGNRSGAGPRVAALGCGVATTIEEIP